MRQGRPPGGRIRGPLAVMGVAAGLIVVQLGAGSFTSEDDGSSGTLVSAAQIRAVASLVDIPSADTVDEVRAADAGDTDTGAEGRSDPTRLLVEDDDDDDDDRRRWWRSRRNVWEGPIPTPAEWAPPEGPIRIGLQAGHWRAAEAPDELRRIRDNGTASRGMAEWEANLEIARRAGAMLEEMGYAVDILPAVVPQSYRAHLFISIHADGSNDPSATGYRVGYPGRDQTGRAGGFADILEDAYGRTTGIRHLTSTTRRMRNYYAFNFRRYEHALHPHTIAVILETGFLTSPNDWRIIVDDPDRSARGIVEAVMAFDVTAAEKLAPPGAVGDGD